MNLKLIGIFNEHEDCTLSKAKKTGVRKLPAERSKINGKRFFIHIRSSSTGRMDGKNN